MTTYIEVPELNEYDIQTGLLTGRALKDVQTGQIHYSGDNQTIENLKEIDRQKGRKIVTFLEDGLPVYVDLNDENNAKQVDEKINRMLACEWEYHDIISWIKKNNRRLDYKGRKRGNKIIFD